MSTVVVIDFCEWDIGVNDWVFDDLNTARQVVGDALKDCGIEESVDDCLEHGYLAFSEKTVQGNNGE